MGKKKRKTVTLDESVLRWLDDYSENDSRLVNDLLTEFISCRTKLDAAIAVRKAEIESEIAEAEQTIHGQERRVEALKEEKKNLESMESDGQTTFDSVLDEAVEKIESEQWQTQYIDSDNPLVKDLSHQAGVTPKRFINALDDRLDDRSLKAKSNGY